MLLIEFDDASKNSHESTVDREWKRERESELIDEKFVRNQHKFLRHTSNIRLRRQKVNRNTQSAWHPVIAHRRNRNTIFQSRIANYECFGFFSLFSLFAFCFMRICLSPFCSYYSLEQIECTAHHRASVWWILRAERWTKFCFSNANNNKYAKLDTNEWQRRRTKKKIELSDFTVNESSFLRLLIRSPIFKSADWRELRDNNNNTERYIFGWMQIEIQYFEATDSATNNKIINRPIKFEHVNSPC